MANNQSVRRHLDAFTRGRIIGKLDSGRPRGTTSADDQYIVLHARRNRRQTAREIARHTTQATGQPISRFIVARRLHGGGLLARRPVRCVPLTPAHRRRSAMGLQFLFMNDNAPCHRTVAAEQLLESGDIERMDCPERSPYLNPIEHVWDFLGRRFAARTLPPVTIRELRLALQDEWEAMPQQLIDTLILGMGRRCETCLAVRGVHIPY
ncbi:transposable element Tc1 transposase [Trichonephila clavipes]|nr:transposable element Tc1 transposase [Trichonephila clavipes]